MKQQINPFTATSTLLARRVSNEQYYPNAPHASYNHSGKSIKNLYLVDFHKKTNLYVPSTQIMDELLFESLSTGALKIFMYVMVHIRNNQDYIQLPYNKLVTICKMSRATVTRCLKELRDLSILAVKGQSVYWVNPTYIFGGNRIKYFSDINPDIIEEI